MSRLMTLNKLELILGIVIALMTVANGVGAWYVLPYRVAQVEHDNKTLSEKFDKHLRDVEQKTELLIRIDERLREMQGQLGKMQTQIDMIQQRRNQ